MGVRRSRQPICAHHHVSCKFSGNNSSWSGSSTHAHWWGEWPPQALSCRRTATQHRLEPPIPECVLGRMTHTETRAQGHADRAEEHFSRRAEDLDFLVPAPKLTNSVQVITSRAMSILHGIQVQDRQILELVTSLRVLPA